MALGGGGPEGMGEAVAPGWRGGGWQRWQREGKGHVEERGTRGMGRWQREETRPRRGGGMRGMSPRAPGGHSTKAGGTREAVRGRAAPVRCGGPLREGPQNPRHGKMGQVQQRECANIKRIFVFQ